MVRVLIAHNRYQQAGGEDTAAEQDVAMLEAAGHEVTTLIVDNAAIRTTSDKVRTAVRLADNPAGVRLVAEALERTGADILHVHNFFPLLSPGVYRAARAAGAGVVQTLHNYRTVCAGALLMRDGAPCHKCLAGSPWWGAFHRCYRGSAVGSAALVRAIAHHRAAGTWQTDVDRFVVLSMFARDMFARAGFPEDRMAVRPNAVEDVGHVERGTRRHVIYVGRLSAEKGVQVLVDAARLVEGEILIVGDGDLAGSLKAQAPANVRFLGQLPRAEVRALVAGARALVLPSQCYEGSPMTLSEAYAAGTPVIGSRLGSLIELIEDGRTGFHVKAGDPADLAARINAMADDGTVASMSIGARRFYERNLSVARSLATLEKVYADVLSMRQAPAGSQGRSSAARTPAQKASAIASME